MITENEILSGFQKLGIERGMMLEVHCSMSSFGCVKEGASTIIAALKEAVGPDGTIFMPALRLSPPLPLSETDKESGIIRKIKILPPDAPRSGMGVTADLFRQMPNVHLGEGVFRIAAWGKYAAEVTSGLQYPLEHGGKALLLGVDIYSLTAMHYVEDILPQKIRDIFSPPEEINKLYPPDEWFIETGAPPAKAWYKIQDMAYNQNLIRETMIGNSKCMFFDLHSVVGLYREELKNNALQLYGLK